MKVSLSVYDIDARDFVELARAADEAGFSDIWLGEHVVLPVDYQSTHPTAGHSAHQHHAGPIIDPETKLLDPFVALSAAASVTHRINLATAIFIAPLRHPLATARASASLHDVSDGRLLLGLGAGWLEEEFAALDVPFNDRGKRLQECLQILRLGWSGVPFDFQGECYRFSRVQVCRKPIAARAILGGNSERALRRAATQADGWFASGTPSFDDAVALRERLLQIRAEQDRPADLPIWVRVPRASWSTLEQYATSGFEHVVIWSDELWPADGDLLTKQETFRARVKELRAVCGDDWFDHGS